MKKSVARYVPVSRPLAFCNKIIARNYDLMATVGAVGLMVGGKAHAALTFTGVTLNTADVESVMMLVIPALAALWGFRKIVKALNRS